MNNSYLTKSRLGTITFASEISPKKIKKNINVKGFFRKGKFVNPFNRKQDVREKVTKHLLLQKSLSAYRDWETDRKSVV